MSNNLNNITLEDIAVRKAAILKRINLQKEKINGLSQGFITPLKPVAKKSNAVMGAFNTSMVVFDGVLIGYKLLRKFRKLFK